MWPDPTDSPCNMATGWRPLDKNIPQHPAGAKQLEGHPGLPRSPTAAKKNKTQILLPQLLVSDLNELVVTTPAPARSHAGPDPSPARAPPRGDERRARNSKSWVSKPLQAVFACSLGVGSWGLSISLCSVCLIWADLSIQWPGKDARRLSS